MNLLNATATPAVERAARAMRADFRKDLAHDDELGDFATVRAGLAAALDVDELTKLLDRCINWELSLLSKNGPYIVCTDCRAHVLDDPELDENLAIEESDAGRIRAAGMRHHAESVRAAIVVGERA
ncbi:hypothetical protein [Promicromonospora sp. NPDC050880]|uniref:hypothetical protein n=1 Tax=Promicromonospora sp. NPDC050880 TaxID=3364406 RepID=UPI0037B47AC3